MVGLVTGLTFFGLVVFTAFLIGTFTPNFSLLNSPEYEGGVAWFIFVFALIPGIWEEVSFRGFILSSLRTKYSVRKAIVFNGLLFAVFHLYNYLLLGQDLVTVLLQSVAAIFVGMSLSYLVIKFNSILPAILIHYSIDVTLFIIDFNIDQGNETLTTIFYIIVLFILPSLLIILGSLVAKKMNVIEDIKTEVKIEQES
ncbi:MAG: CPBP family intramembrane metalloprotease [Asgard group archaeon]|nr:CPBP family intramembrane metalloprotease [Asgard group archaeon]